MSRCGSSSAPGKDPWLQWVRLTLAKPFSWGSLASQIYFLALSQAGNENTPEGEKLIVKSSSPLPRRTPLVLIHSGFYWHSSVGKELLLKMELGKINGPGAKLLKPLALEFKAHILKSAGFFLLCHSLGCSALIYGHFDSEDQAEP